MKEPFKTKRITADFSEDAFRTLEEVANRLHTSKADTLRRALGLIQFVLEQQDADMRVIIEGKNGKDRREIVTL